MTANKIGEALPQVHHGMMELAQAFDPDELAHQAFHLYEQFRPRIPEGVRGWGARGELDLKQLRDMALQAH